jgi:integrase
MGRRKQLRNVERRSWRRADGTVAETFRVRWVDEDGARQRETFDTAEEAVAFRDELEARVAMLRGGPAERARMTVADGYERWWAEHVEPTLERRTQDGYRRVWESHLAGRVGDLLLIDLTTARIEQLKDAMLGDGVGAHTVRKAIALLGSLLGHAARRGHVEHNAALAVRKPSPRSRTKRRRMPPSIEVVDAIRTAALDQLDSPLTAIWVSIGAYAGLRPGEVRALRWRDIGERTIAVADAIDVDGTRRGHTKTYRDRAAELLPVLRDDLAAWREATPYADDDDPVTPTGRGEPIDDEGYKNFVGRKFRPAAAAAGWPCAPYDLRHFNASLLIKEGRLSTQEVAGHLGHTLIELSRTYARELAEYRGRHLDIGAEIARVRGYDVEPSEAPLGRPAQRQAPDDLVVKLIDLNAAGVLTDAELAIKLRALRA